jgi:hypothetical protein
LHPCKTKGKKEGKLIAYLKRKNNILLRINICIERKEYCTPGVFGRK